jgi:4,5-DOPA dioxygenase extradiol
VVPLSVQPHADAASHYRLGQALAGLADEGVLVIGSGGFVHNLGELAWGHPDAPMPGWAKDFRDWMRDRVLTGDVDALLVW